VSGFFYAVAPRPAMTLLVIIFVSVCIVTALDRNYPKR
jgi:hypothetical protein